MDNLELYNSVRTVPNNAQKKILGGRLKGMTDINPMWRIEKLTEQFGPCGIGWKYEIAKQWNEPGANGEISAFCNVNLYVKTGDGWSEPIPGTGGSAFVTTEKNGLYTSDECYKMALTDAISVACKALGMGADVYWNKCETKYNKYQGGDIIQKMPDSELLKCADCGKEINISVHDFSVKKYKRPLCIDCQKKVGQ